VHIGWWREAAEIVLALKVVSTSSRQIMVAKAIHVVANSGPSSRGNTYVCVETQPKFPVFNAICAFSCMESYIPDLGFDEAFNFLLAIVNVLRIIIPILRFCNICRRLIHSIPTLRV
jgi:hypothetical protein